LLMLLFIVTAGWALYVHSTTGSYPAFVNKLVGASQQLPQTLRALKPAQPTAQEKSTNQSAQSGGMTDADASLNNLGTQAASPPHNAPGAVTQTPPDDSGVAPSATPTATASQSSNQAPANDGASVVPVTSPATQPAGAAPSSQPGTAEGIASAPAENLERSPFSPVGPEEQTNSATAAQPTKKPIRQPLPVVDGFTRKNVPELLRAADSEAQRGDYRLAAYSYNLVLKLDHTNVPARTGLRLIEQAKHLH
jgi:hypothetical protein